MKRSITAILFLLGVSATAGADVWKWVDANGDTHYVDTMTPIYTWLDDSGKVHYSDKPEHENAVSVKLVWHSPGTLANAEPEAAAAADEEAYPGETAEDRAERLRARAYHCKRATEIYDSYVNAPQLYRTDETGERVFLSKEEAAATIAETKARRDKYCVPQG